MWRDGNERETIIILSHTHTHTDARMLGYYCIVTVAATSVVVATAISWSSFVAAAAADVAATSDAVRSRRRVRFACRPATVVIGVRVRGASCCAPVLCVCEPPPFRRVPEVNARPSWRLVMVTFDDRSFPLVGLALYHAVVRTPLVLPSPL